MKNKIKLAMIMDPIQNIKVHKDSSFAMLLEAQKRGWSLFYIEQSDMFIQDGRTMVKWQSLEVCDQATDYFSFKSSGTSPLDELADVLLMRKDPPFDMEYIYSTYMMDLAEQRGVLMVNKPQSLRDANEKLFTSYFPQCCTPMLVSRSMQDLRDFVVRYEDVIVKPLDQMGGASIFRLQPNDQNLSVVLENMTNFGQQSIMAQKYIPEITELGDKRILIVDGVPVPYTLARIPQKGETRGNLAAGGSGVGVLLTARDKWICEQVSQTFKDKGLIFVGIDVIGDYLTEVNVTSPTCIRELDTLFDLNIAGQLMDAIERRLIVS